MPRRRAVAWSLALLAYLAVRGWLATTPGYPPDIGQFKLWALQAEQDGLASLYGGGADHDFSRFDYPPFYAYVLRAIGWIYSFFEPDALARQADSTLLTVLVKLPALLADLAVALLLARLARRGARGDGGNGNGGSGGNGGAAPWLAAAWLLNPAVLLDGGHWGQPDSIHSGFVLAAFAALSGGLGAARGTRRSAIAAWVLLTLAALMKPLGAPFFPLLLTASLLLTGVASTLFGALASLATAALLFAPFVARFGVEAMAARLLGDVTIMSFTSVNGHNLWWLVGPWKDSEAPWLLGATATQVGLALFLSALAALLVLSVRRHRQRRAGLHAVQLLLLSGALATAFFLFATHLHENHLFAALPLLMGALALSPAGNGARRPLALLIAALSLGVAWNLVAHDFAWRHVWPFSSGDPRAYVGDAPEGVLAGGEHLAGTLGSAWNLLCGAALAAFVFGHGLVRLAWSGALPAEREDGDAGESGASS